MLEFEWKHVSKGLPRLRQEVEICVHSIHDSLSSRKNLILRSALIPHPANDELFIFTGTSELVVTHWKGIVFPDGVKEWETSKLLNKFFDRGSI